MQQDYLLTYSLEGVQTYAWFTTEEEMNEFIECNEDKTGFSINDKLQILNAKALE